MEGGIKGDICFPDTLNICEITVRSGTRASGRTASHENGRKNNGFLYIWEGEAVFFTGNQRICSAAAGELVFLPRGKAYRMTYTAPATTFVLVNFELLDRRGEPFSLADAISTVKKDDERQSIAKLMLKFEQCSASVNQASVWRRQELAYRLLAMSSEFFEQAAGEDILRQIVDGVRLLRQTYLENLPIETYAKACSLSTNRFRELFHRQFGLSPVKYRNRLRIERARILLGEEDLTISEVAYASGFENLGYFYRCYLQETGETPAETKTKRRE